MKRALEFHHSTVASVHVKESCLVVELSEAYIHESEGEPGVTAGNGYLQAATLTFSGTQTQLQSGLEGRLWDGRVSIQGELVGLLPVPLNAYGQVVAELNFETGQNLQITATGLSVTTHGEARWVEAYGG